MDERLIKPSKLYQDLDARQQELQNAFRSDLNKMKAHRKRSNNSVSEIKEQVDIRATKNNSVSEVSFDDDDAFEEKVELSVPQPSHQKVS